MPKSNKTRPSLADRADKHQLYQDTVQCVEAEIDFVDETFKALRKRRAKILREDFCGTASTSCEWVRRRRSNIAIGVDLDEDVLQWGRTRNVTSLSSGAKRITLLHEDVLKAQTPPADAILAMNFSYWIFRRRAHLRRYFERVLKCLTDDGIFFLDAYGGHEAFEVKQDIQEYDGYTYFWDQAEYNPISGDMTCHIHFRFPDGSRLEPAFSYHWRLWTLPEIREVLLESGFSRATVYWQGTDEETGDGDGI
ncbi:MAG: class I SAM-dependent methyltransferase, partial [Chromatiales bacterium]|nr:class I SAM-dependent methyltransferase [Chromatiales bacterium]